MKTIKQYFAHKKEVWRDDYEERIRDSFDVEERNGQIYLTHQGIAFMKIPVLTQVQEITKELRSARDCAIEFERSCSIGR